mmetsp:Transcript_1898/g.1308  ORF Transcript_1898/g.1308 Transcript_1898/m.1308 type:complete len:89 (-) Transcript_1898:125-391(-)
MSEMSFAEAGEKVPKIKTTTVDEQLEMYKWYKQATNGDIEIQRPGLLDPKGRAKWDAWNSVKGTSKEESEAKYVEVVKSLVDKYGLED